MCMRVRNKLKAYNFKRVNKKLYLIFNSKFNKKLNDQ